MGALEIIFDVLKVSKEVNTGIANGAIDSGASAWKGLTKVVDVTVAYPEGRPLDLGAICLATRPPCVTHVHYRVFDINDVSDGDKSLKTKFQSCLNLQIPKDKEGAKNWMYQLYYDKDKMLAKYYETGVFPYDMFDNQASPPTELHHDPFRFFLLHLFFIVSSCVMWRLFILIGILQAWFWHFQITTKVGHIVNIRDIYMNQLVVVLSSTADLS